jgi:predicted esterase
LGLRGRDRLDALGVDLTARDYTMGHQIVAEEMDDLAEWLSTVQPPQ